MTASYDDFAKLEFRVAEVVEAREHPDAQRLLVLTVRTGEETRQVVAGIKAAYAPQDLVGRQVVLVANLQPAVIRGVESQGMLLAADAEGGPALLRPDRAVASGSKVR